MLFLKSSSYCLRETAHKQIKIANLDHHNVFLSSQIGLAFHFHQLLYLTFHFFTYMLPINTHAAPQPSQFKIYIHLKPPTQRTLERGPQMLIRPGQRQKLVSAQFPVLVCVRCSKRRVQQLRRHVRPQPPQHLFCVLLRQSSLSARVLNFEDQAHGPVEAVRALFVQLGMEGGRGWREEGGVHG